MVEILKTSKDAITFEVQHSAALERRISRRQLLKLKELEAQDQRETGQAGPATGSADDGSTVQSPTASASAVQPSAETNENELHQELDIVVEKASDESFGLGFSSGDASGSRPLTIRKVR